MHRMLQVLDVIEAGLAAVADVSSAFLTVAEKAEGGPPVGGGRGPRAAQRLAAMAAMAAADDVAEREGDRATWRLGWRARNGCGGPTLRLTCVWPAPSNDTGIVWLKRCGAAW